ncbi:MAG: DUF2147 domain-containing protein [Marinilabiliales bacterium]|nr:MAG: DUF2147 domain-containing protein [Marinilabiliales bacterium]
MKLKAILMLMMAMVITPFTQLNAQDFKADDILGVWMNEDKDAHVEIYKEGNKYFGKIVWLLNPIDEETNKPKLDDKNEDLSLRDRPVMGLLLLKDFVFDGDDEWEDGQIYDPKNGKTYSCYMEFEDEDDMSTLKIRGYIGISLLGRTTYWTAVK